MKGKALRRALGTADAVRINTNLPLIVDKTEIISPEAAEEMLKKNKVANRPVNWRKVEEYAVIMGRGEWKLHAQGIICDPSGNILTGQTRLWAIVYSGVNVPMRISRGNPRDVAKLIDRGRPQSARDLASRDTKKKHSPTEASIARAMCAAKGTPRPTLDELAEVIAGNTEKASTLLLATKGTKKTKAILMVMGAICSQSEDASRVKAIASRTGSWADKLESQLSPQSADKCWNSGAAFTLAMTVAIKIVPAG